MAWVIGAVGDIDRWPSSRKLRKALGFYGVTKQSGGTNKTYHG